MPVYPGHLKTVVCTHLSTRLQTAVGTGFSYETEGLCSGPRSDPTSTPSATSPAARSPLRI